MRNPWLVGVWGIILVLMVGCQPSSAAVTPTASATVSPTSAPTNQPILPTTTPSTPEPLTLVVWLPDELYPIEDDALSAILGAEVTEFSAQAGVQIELRRKKSDDVGGILATLRAGASVAPGALPDLTLMRRSDLLIAANEGLIYPMEGRIASAVIADLYPSALRLGRADDQLYGLPYLLDVYLTAYRAEVVDLTRWTFANVVEAEISMAIPAASAIGLNDVLWLQYLSAGGLIPEPEEALNLAPSPVLTILNFYEEMAEAGFIPRAVLDYDSPEDYLQLLTDGRLDAGIITTANLRALRNTNTRLGYAGVPTPSGDPFTLVDGWMWVIVTPNAEKQVWCGRFLNWMMDAERQSTYATGIAMPPSQRTSLRRWTFDGLDNDLLSELLSDSPPPMPEVSASSAARALQSALMDVLSGEMSATEAAATALSP